jgi:oligopeptide/dipeptide ABC transporter ATP-binding protein
MVSIPRASVTEQLRAPSGPAEPSVPSTPVLEVRNLTIGIKGRKGITTLVHGVDFTVGAGERLGVVGESGSGKSLTMLAVMGLLAPPLVILDGSIRIDGRELVGAPESTLRGVRGSDVAMVYQDPMTSLDPMQRVGVQVAEGLRGHGVDRHESETRVLAALDEVGLPAPERTARMYPHQLSGGMRQRVMIASALVGEPRVLIADEPTTALDVTIQRQILRLVARLSVDHHMAVAWITHDLGVVAQFAQRVAVMYAGRVVETAPTRQLFHAPEHPYSAALLSSLPSPTGTEKRLPQIGGMAADPARPPSGCAFHPRCPRVIERCRVDVPPLEPRPSGGTAACWVPLGGGS